jgi:hypothetical protein
MDNNLAIRDDYEQNTRPKQKLHPAMIPQMGKGRPKGSKNKSTLAAIKEIKEADLFCREITSEHVKRYKRMIEFKQLVKVAEKLDSATLEPVDEIKLRLDTARTVKTDPQEVVTRSMELTISSSDLIKLQELAKGLK